MNPGHAANDISFTMSNNWFQFKQFLVNQDNTAMKVGTDGVLLGAWAGRSDGERANRWLGLKESLRMLDIGTGTGLLALMLAQRFPEALIDAVELEPASFRQASRNVSQSPWPARIQVIEADFLRWEGRGCYHLIICNPPYFRHSLRAPVEARRLARHDDQLPLDRLIAKSAGLLCKNGYLALSIPHERISEVVALAAKSGLALSRLLRIRATPRSAIKRVLVQLGVQSGIVKSDELCIRDHAGAELSASYHELTDAFYL